MKDYFIEIKTTYKNLKLAKETAQMLINYNWVACAQISKIESWYKYENQLHNEKEILLTLKTKKLLYHKIKKAIIKNHEYKTPQIISQKIDDGLDSYLKWIDSSLKNPQNF